MASSDNESEMDSPDALNELAIEFNGMNNAMEKINEIQNNIALAQSLLEQLHEKYKKRMVDLRLKHKKRIDEALAYHRAVKEAEEMGQQAERIMQIRHEKLTLLAAAKEQLTIGSSLEYTQKLSEINTIRESAKNALTDYESLIDTQQTKLVCVTELAKRYRRSIELTRDYFDTRDSGQAVISEQKHNLEQLRAELVDWKQRYGTHVGNLRNISERKHLERGTLNILEQTLAKQPSMATDNDVTSLASYNLESIETDTILDSFEGDSSFNSGTDTTDQNPPISQIANSMESSAEHRLSHSMSSAIGSNSTTGSKPNNFQSLVSRSAASSFSPSHKGYIVHREENVQSHPLA